LFITPSQGYNAIIHLDCKKLLKYLTNVTYDSTKAPTKTSKFKNALDPKDKELIKLSNIDPLRRYLQDLHKCFADVAYFFADIHGGDKVAIVWKPLSDSKFKANLSYNAKENVSLYNVGFFHYCKLRCYAGRNATNGKRNRCRHRNINITRVALFLNLVFIVMCHS
jgi:hypothetical protein